MDPLSGVAIHVIAQLLSHKSSNLRKSLTVFKFSTKTVFKTKYKTVWLLHLVVRARRMNLTTVCSG